MTSSSVPAVPATPSPTLDTAFGDVWPERSLPARPRLVVAALVAGLVAAVVLPYRDAGLGTFLVLMSVCGVVARADRRLASPYHLASGTLCTLLIATVVVRDAQWVVTLCLLAACAVGVAALVDARSVAGLLAAGFAVPLAALRGLPWLGRSVSGTPTARSVAPAARTIGVSLALLLVFGVLFASADALFASWAGALLPDISAPTLVLRGFVLVAFSGLTLTGVYVALNPPRLERLAVPAGTPVTRPFEWLVPVGVVVGVFAMFVLAQLAVMFGGHDYLRRTTGLTYADYVHQGFGQLTFATVLTLGVVAVAARKAPRSTSRERLVLRGLLGVLCLLTLVVVGSALYRMHVYEQAYGFTRLRVLVSLFEAWLGLVVLLVMGAGSTLRGRWVPRAVLLSGAAALLVLAAANPDSFIARRNLDRFHETGKLDTSYLVGLSADAVPALRQAGCPVIVPPAGDDWLEWNLGRHRARSSVAVTSPGSCVRP